MTPGELNKLAKAVADLLGRESNSDLTAEELADEITSTIVEGYEEIQAKSYNLIVLGHFRLNETESYVAAVGPLSTRAQARARGVGEHFAWDYKTRKGTGKFTTVPLIRNPNQAWDHLRAEQKPPQEVRKAFTASHSLSANPFGPACICGLDTTLLKEQGKYFLCPVHPEGRDDR